MLNRSRTDLTLVRDARLPSARAGPQSILRPRSERQRTVVTVPAEQWLGNMLVQQYRQPKPIAPSEGVGGTDLIEC